MSGPTVYSYCYCVVTVDPHISNVIDHLLRDLLVSIFEYNVAKTTYHYFVHSHFGSEHKAMSACILCRPKTDFIDVSLILWWSSSSDVSHTIVAEAELLL